MKKDKKSFAFYGKKNNVKIHYFFIYKIMETIKNILLLDLNFLSFIIFAVWIVISTFIFERRLNRIKGELDTKVFKADYWKFKAWVDRKIWFNLEEVKFEVGEEVFFEKEGEYRKGEIVSFKFINIAYLGEIKNYLIKDKQTGYIYENGETQIYKEKAKK